MGDQAVSVLLDVGLVAVLVLVGVRLYRRRRSVTRATTSADRPVATAISSRAEAERAAAAHLAGLGFTDARPVPDGARDDAVDVVGRDVDAHVRWHAKPTDVPTVQRVRAAARTRAVVYSFAGCTRPALRLADAEDVALFRLQVDGAAIPLNDAAKALPGA